MTSKNDILNDIWMTFQPPSRHIEMTFKTHLKCHFNHPFAILQLQLVRSSAAIADENISVYCIYESVMAVELLPRLRWCTGDDWSMTEEIDWACLLASELLALESKSRNVSACESWMPETAMAATFQSVWQHCGRNTSKQLA